MLINEVKNELENHIIPFWDALRDDEFGGFYGQMDNDLNLDKKGGKGILSGGTIAIMIDWRIALVVWGGFLLLAILTRYVSLGSVWAGASFPFISWYCYPDPVIVALAFVIGGLVVWKHRANIHRLIHGNESKFSFHHKKEGSQ